MAEVLKFDVVRPRKVETRREDDFSFWPEVSRGLWASESQSANPANTQGRVLFEMLLILGTTAVIATAVSFFVGAPPV